MAARLGGAASWPGAVHRYSATTCRFTVCPTVPRDGSEAGTPGHGGARVEGWCAAAAASTARAGLRTPDLVGDPAVPGVVSAGVTTIAGDKRSSARVRSVGALSLSWMARARMICALVHEDRFLMTLASP